MSVLALLCKLWLCSQLIYLFYIRVRVSFLFRTCMYFHLVTVYSFSFCQMDLYEPYNITKFLFEQYCSERLIIYFNIIKHYDTPGKKLSTVCVQKSTFLAKPCTLFFSMYKALPWIML